jgi:general secretion pathway protein G
MRRKSGGFTIIEVLVVVGIIGVLSAIAIMAYTTAMTRTRQRRTMADIRAIAVAWEARAADHRQYNAAGFTMPAAAVPYGDMATILAPNYIKTVPTHDGWGSAFQFALDSAVGSTTPASTYAIRSPGADGLFDATITPGAFEDPNTDIVYSGGTFITFPQGIQ